MQGHHSGRACGESGVLCHRCKKTVRTLLDAELHGVGMDIDIVLQFRHSRDGSVLRNLAAAGFARATVQADSYGTEGLFTASQGGS